MLETIGFGGKFHLRDDAKTMLSRSNSWFGQSEGSLAQRRSAYTLSKEKALFPGENVFELARDN